MSMVTEKYNMTKVVLENYRFGNNPEMLKLDSNVRENAATYFAPILAKNVHDSQHFGAVPNKRKLNDICKGAKPY